MDFDCQESVLYVPTTFSSRSVFLYMQSLSITETIDGVYLLLRKKEAIKVLSAVALWCTRREALQRLFPVLSSMQKKQLRILGVLLPPNLETTGRL